MHPEISCLPSRVFYQGRLQDGPDMDIKTKQPWQSHPKFGTYRFFNVQKGIEESGGRSSLKNMAECQVAVALYSCLVKEFANIDFSYRVGIVSMYRAQIVELRRQFERRFGSQIIDTVDFNTVDGFQGQEKDVIILSCVRSGPGLQSVGFLSGMFPPFCYHRTQFCQTIEEWTLHSLEQNHPFLFLGMPPPLKGATTNGEISLPMLGHGLH